MSKQLINIQTSRRAMRAVVLAAAFVAALAMTGGATAQSPTPGHKMEDSRPGNGWPDSASAAVVEGLGSLGCLYSESSIKSQTVSWINAGHWVVTEISPQPGCGSLSAYEGLLNRIKNYVEANAAAPGNHWAGFMLDEEPDFGFSVSSLEALNQYTENIMVSTPGMSWYFTEDFPRGSAGDWTLAQYNAILGYSWPAPQVYNSFMIGFVNNECSVYGNCTNNVTVDSQLAYPWNSPSWVTSQIHGSPWTDFGYWCSCNWYNLWRPQ